MYRRFFGEKFSQQQNFVAATSRTNSVSSDFLRHVAATKIFAKIIQYTRVTAACYCKLSPCVFRPKLAIKMTIDLDKSTSSHSLCSYSASHILGLLLSLVSVFFNAPFLKSQIELNNAPRSAVLGRVDVFCAGALDGEGGGGG